MRKVTRVLWYEQCVGFVGRQGTVHDTDVTELGFAHHNSSEVAQVSAYQLGEVGAEGGNRTRTWFPKPDFESGASTSSATSASVWRD